MTESEKTNLLQAYHNRKSEKKLRANLSKPTPRNLKNECLIVYKEKGLPKEDETLRLFFETAGEEHGYITIIEQADIDKFRPLVLLLKRDNYNPHDKHYWMLKWLMGAVDGDKKEKKRGKDGREITVTQKTLGLLITIVLIAAVYWDLTRQCMYWTGDHYEISSCLIKKSNTAVIAFDEQKASHLKRITHPDTITYKAIGHVWYVKINNLIEYYTAPGFHPIDGKKKLKPITIYMIDKHIIAAKSK